MDNNKHVQRQHLKDLIEMFTLSKVYVDIYYWEEKETL